MASASEEHLPRFYLPPAPGERMVASGVWHPSPVGRKRIRDAIVSHTRGWSEVVRGCAPSEGESHVNVPAGSDPAPKFADDLRRKDSFSPVVFEDAEVTSGNFDRTFPSACTQLDPRNQFLTHALGNLIPGAFDRCGPRFGMGAEGPDESPCRAFAYVLVPVPESVPRHGVDSAADRPPGTFDRGPPAPRCREPQGPGDAELSPYSRQPLLLPPLDLPARLAVRRLHLREVALLWLVLQITGSAFAVGIVVTGTILPGVLLGPFLGVFIDRWDRRRTLLVTNLVQGGVIASLAGLVLAGDANLAGLFVIVLMLGSGATIVRIATNAYVPSVVSVADLSPANSLLAVSSSTNAILGLSIGGVVVALFGVALPIEYDAVTFFAAAVLLLLIPRPAGLRGPSPVASARGFRAEFAEGLAFIRRHRFMVELIAIGVVVNFFGNGVAALLAPYADFVLHGGPATYGLLGAFFAGGSLVGAGAMGRVDTRRSAGRYLFGGGALIGVGILALGVAGSIPLALAVMLSLGAAITVTNIPIGVVIQAKVPGRLLGRVGAAFGALVSATGPGGPMFAGWLAQRWSVSDVFLLSGTVCVVVIGLGSVIMTALRSVEY